MGEERPLRIGLLMSRKALFHRLEIAWFWAPAVLACLAIAVLLASNLAIAWSGDPSLNTLICGAGDDQVSPVIVGDCHGGNIIIWQDHRSGVDWDVYAQKVSPTGAIQWADAGTAVCVISNDQTLPNAISDGCGGAIIAWQDSRDSNLDIYAQRMGSAGEALWTATGVPICSASHDQTCPVLVGDGAGGAVVIWQDKRNGSDYDIYAQKVNDSGITQWITDGVAMCTAASDQTHITAVGDTDGGALVAWQDKRNNAYDIYAQRVDSSCAPLWIANGVVVCTAAGPQIAPAMVEDGLGGAIVTWCDGRNEDDYDIYSQRLDGAGFAQWTLSGVPICAAAGDQNSPAAVSDGHGGAIVAWQDARGSTHYDVYAQRVDSTGDPRWATDGAPVCAATGDQRSPVIVRDESGGAVIAWRDCRLDSNFDIYGQRLDSTSNAQWTADGVPICTAPGNQSSLSAVSDGSGGCIVTWEDSRAATRDICAQRVEGSGVLSQPPEQPRNLSPTDGEEVGLTPTLRCTPFSPAEPGETHAASQWRITTTAGDYSGPIFDSGPDSFGLLQVTVDTETLTGSTTYYWEVRHQGGNGLWSPWSPETSFTTLDPTPNQPGNLSPTDHEEVVSLTPTLKCSAFSPAEPGETHVASQWRITTTAGDYSSPVFDSGPDNHALLQLALPSGRLDVGTTYYWQVRQLSSNGLWSPWSIETSFATVNKPPDRPTTIWPPPGGEPTSLTPTLGSSAFSDPDSGDTHAASQWQVSTISGEYSNPIVDSTHAAGSSLTSITIAAAILDPGTVYYWRVRYQDNHAAWSDWSAEATFVTRSDQPVTENHPPDRPVCLSPEDGAEDISTAPTLEASAFEDPDAGDCLAASQWQMTVVSGDYRNPVFDRVESLDASAIHTSNLDRGRTYYWRVRYKDSRGMWSDWSEESSFSTQAGGSGDNAGGASLASWVYVAGIMALAVLVISAVAWRNVQAAKVATR